MAWKRTNARERCRGAECGAPFHEYAGRISERDESLPSSSHEGGGFMARRPPRREGSGAGGKTMKQFLEECSRSIPPSVPTVRFHFA